MNALSTPPVEEKQSRMQVEDEILKCAQYCMEKTQVCIALF